MSKEYLHYPFFNHTMLELISKHDMIIADFDDVIATPKQYFCSSQWFVQKIKNLERNNVLGVLSKFVECAKTVSLVAVSPELNSYLTEISTIKPVVILTARPEILATVTENNMKQLQIGFSKNIGHPLTRNSIFYAGDMKQAEHRNKGEIVDELLEFFPEVKSVLFLDDSKKNTDHVVAALADNDTHNVTVIHFTEIADRVHGQYPDNVLKQMAEIQQHYFELNGDFISDEEALGLLGEL